MRGRAKHFFNGQEICNNYNGPKGCIRDRCNYSHVCLSCHNSHPQRKCPELMSSKKTDRIKKRAGPSQPYNQVSLPEVSTPLNIEQFKHYLEYHPDQEFVKYLIDGFSYGFHTGLKKLPSSTLELNNLLSARCQPEITRNLISKEVEKGFLSGPYENMPFPVYRVNPIGVAEGKYSNKKRLIVDLSAPHDDTSDTSLNSLIDKEEYSLNYVTTDHAIKIIKQTGIHSCMCKADISDAFKLVPIHPTLWPFHGIKWEGKYYFYTRLVFGSRSSPKIFDSFSRAICWIAKNKFHIDNILHLLDDFLTIDPPEFMAERTMALLLMLFKTLNIPIAAHKTEGPTTCLEYLGIILDSKLSEARLPTNKVDRINGILKSFLDKKSCSKKKNSC